MPGNIDDVAIGAKHDIALTLPPDEKHEGPASAHQAVMPPVFQGEVMPTVYDQEGFGSARI